MGGLRALTTDALIIRRPLPTLFTLLFILKLSYVQLMATAIMISTYSIVQVIPKEIYKYHLCTKVKKYVMIFSEWIKYMLNFDKELEHISRREKWVKFHQSVLPSK